MSALLRCPDCGRRSVSLYDGRGREPAYWACQLARPGKAYAPCAWFAFVDDPDGERPWHTENRAELARLRAANQGVGV